MFLNITVMENYIVVLLLSVVVVLVAIYGYNVEQRIFQIKEEFGNEIEKVKEKLELTSEEIRACHKKMIEAGKTCREEIYQTKINMATFKDEFLNAEIQRKNETNKVKVELESMREQINTHLEETIKKDITYRKEQNETKEKVITLHKETMTSLRETDNQFKNTLNNIKKEKTEHEISFSARLGTSIADINAWDTVVFDQVISNNGNSYNAATGIFTAPIGGSYYFSSTIMTFKGSTPEIALKVNADNKMWMFPCASTQIGNAATNTIIIKLKRDDKVRMVKHGTWHVRPFYIHAYWSTFTGFLL